MIKILKSCQVGSVLMLRFAEWQYDWTSKGHLNVTTNMGLRLISHTATNKKGV